MPDFKTLTAEQVLIDLRRDDVKIVDVRTSPEWNQSHIPGALHIPLNEFAELYKAHLGEDDEIILYCQHGVRSKQAAHFLAMNGCTNVSHMSGGLSAWNGPTDPE